MHTGVRDGRDGRIRDLVPCSTDNDDVSELLCEAREDELSRELARVHATSSLLGLDRGSDFGAVVRTLCSSTKRARSFSDSVALSAPTVRRKRSDGNSIDFTDWVAAPGSATRRNLPGPSLAGTIGAKVVQDSIELDWRNSDGGENLDASEAGGNVALGEAKVQGQVRHVPNVLNSDYVKAVYGRTFNSDSGFQFAVKIFAWQECAMVRCADQLYKVKSHYESNPGLLLDLWKRAEFCSDIRMLPRCALVDAGSVIDWLAHAHRVEVELDGAGPATSSHTVDADQKEKNVDIVGMTPIANMFLSDCAVHFLKRLLRAAVVLTTPLDRSDKRFVLRRTVDADVVQAAVAHVPSSPNAPRLKTALHALEPWSAQGGLKPRSRWRRVSPATESNEVLLCELTPMRFLQVPKNAAVEAQQIARIMEDWALPEDDELAAVSSESAGSEFSAFDSNTDSSSREESVSSESSRGAYALHAHPTACVLDEAFQDSREPVFHCGTSERLRNTCRSQDPSPLVTRDSRQPAHSLVQPRDGDSPSTSAHSWQTTGLALGSDDVQAQSYTSETGDSLRREPLARDRKPAKPLCLPEEDMANFLATVRDFEWVRPRGVVCYHRLSWLAMHFCGTATVDGTPDVVPSGERKADGNESEKRLPGAAKSGSSASYANICEYGTFGCCAANVATVIDKSGMDELYARVELVVRDVAERLAMSARHDDRIRAWIGAEDVALVSSLLGMPYAYDASCSEIPPRRGVQ